MKKIFIIFSVLLLIYMLWPGPQSISDFKALPNSDKSDLAGDTWQIPDVAGYFSDNYREFVIPFYKLNYLEKSFFPFSPLRINYPPEFSWNVIKKHTDSTYLEELVYPLRDSLYINGFEPFYSDGTPRYWGAAKFITFGHEWETKVTLRFYPSPVWVRFIVWLGIVIGTIFLFKLGRKVIAD
ncbi:hypothetical protein HYW43_04910 [Candidatus Daviesbacteria bacterium]|nr:hypothetical protein [Candidatus Daviesbacteria bacterium]